MDKMKPGPELDALIAEKVIGLEPWPTQDPRWGIMAFKAPIVPYGEEPKPCQAPPYSTDISHAWEVVEKLKQMGLMVDIQVASEFQHVQVDKLADGHWDVVVESTEGDTAPHAICLAALAACGVEL